MTSHYYGPIRLAEIWLLMLICYERKMFSSLKSTVEVVLKNMDYFLCENNQLLNACLVTVSYSYISDINRRIFDFGLLSQ